MYNHHAYLIKTLTHTHMGAYNSTSELIDNMIQRDTLPIDKNNPEKHHKSLPVIHASSLKGAIKDHFAQRKSDRNKQPKNAQSVKPFTFDILFGKADQFSSGKDEISKKNKTAPINIHNYRPKQGLLKFYKANLLTTPLSSTSNIFYHATSTGIAIHFFSSLKQFGLLPGKEADEVILFFQKLQDNLTSTKKDFVVIQKLQDDLNPDDNDQKEKDATLLSNQYPYIAGSNHCMTIETKMPAIAKHYFPAHAMNSLAIYEHQTFLDLYNENMPIISRNRLSDQRESKNLFFEEILPKYSTLWFVCGSYHLAKLQNDQNNSQLQNYEKDRICIESAYTFFEKRLLNDTIQMGANASIGYGMTSIGKLPTIN